MYSLHNTTTQLTYCDLYSEYPPLEQVPISTESIVYHHNSHQPPEPVQPTSDTSHRAVLNDVHKPERNKKKCVMRSGVDTSSFTIEERLVAAVWVHERKNMRLSIAQIKCDFRERFGREPPANVNDAPRPGRPCKRSMFVPRVCASLSTMPDQSVRARAAQLHVPRSTLTTILRTDINTNNKITDNAKKHRRSTLHTQK